MTTWGDAVYWADRLPTGQKLDVWDVEQEVFDRAPYILHVEERLRGIWSLCKPRSVGNQVSVALFGLAPIAGGLAFIGDVQFRNIQSPGVSLGVARQIVSVSFGVGFLCQVLAIAGWMRMGRRTLETDFTQSGLLLAGSALTLTFAVVRDGVTVADHHLWAAWGSLIAALIAIAAFSLARSETPLPTVDIEQLTERESAVLVDQRDAALRIAAKRQVVRLRTVNRAVGKPLGSLIERRRG